tara:strand:+ start:4004 stop:4969 length:966 start_codon:yes stop_codon:yes gene_type:complete
MQFYNKQHDFYCGIDLHARILYVCIISQQGEAEPAALMALIQPYKDKMVMGVECMHCWYWVSDFCQANNIEFVLGHALYMKAIHGGKAKNDKIDSYKFACLLRGGNFPLAYRYPKEMRATRDLLRRRTRIVRHGADLKAHVSNTFSQYNLPAHYLNLRYPYAREKLRGTFSDLSAQRNIDLDLNIVDFYTHELSSVECFILKNAKQHNSQDFNLLNTFPGIGRILALTIIYEVGDIRRFDTVQKFASYCRLIKCKAESAGKTYGTQGNKIGNDKAKRYLERLQKRMSKAKALSALSHKVGRCVYFMLKNKTVFDEERFLKS